MSAGLPWAVVVTGEAAETAIVHVVPVDDLREHALSEDCWCKPIEDHQEDVWVHNSGDLREHTAEKSTLN